MNLIPIYISLVFGFTTLLTGFFLYKASHYHKDVLFVLLAFLVIQGLLGIFHFYEVFEGFPPRFPFLILPAFIMIFLLFLTKNGKKYIDNLDIKTLTYLHIIRIPVEMVCYPLLLCRLSFFHI